MRIVKLILCIVLCIGSVWSGLFLALFAKVSEDSPYDQGALALLAALLVCVGVLFAGIGNSLCKKKKESGGTR